MLRGVPCCWLAAAASVTSGGEARPSELPAFTSLATISDASKDCGKRLRPLPANGTMTVGCSGTACRLPHMSSRSCAALSTPGHTPTSARKPRSGCVPSACWPMRIAPPISRSTAPLVALIRDTPVLCRVCATTLVFTARIASPSAVTVALTNAHWPSRITRPSDASSSQPESRLPHDTNSCPLFVFHAFTNSEMPLCAVLASQPDALDAAIVWIDPGWPLSGASTLTQAVIVTVPDSRLGDDPWNIPSALRSSMNCEPLKLPTSFWRGRTPSASGSYPASHCSSAAGCAPTSDISAAGLVALPSGAPLRTVCAASRVDACCSLLLTAAIAAPGSAAAAGVCTTGAASNTLSDSAPACVVFALAALRNHIPYSAKPTSSSTGTSRLSPALPPFFPST
mmetsp:Transcript_45722/g.120516  ORF Transcript_45722/g.120516 Transcript_45722/m.120516 type:complete len:397 (+) Transcript_45722:2033-3223(+)